jgi:hypothetical protein
VKAAARVWPEVCLATGGVLMSAAAGALLVLGGLW